MLPNSTGDKIMRALRALPEARQPFTQSQIRSIVYNYNVRLTATGLRAALDKLAQQKLLVIGKKGGINYYRIAPDADIEKANVKTASKTVSKTESKLPPLARRLTSSWAPFEQIYADAVHRAPLTTTRLGLRKALHRMVAAGFVERKGAGPDACWRVAPDAAHKIAAHAEEQAKKLAVAAAFKIPAPPPVPDGKKFFLVVHNGGVGGVDLESYDDLDEALAAWTNAKTGGAGVRLFQGVEVKPTLTAKLL